VEALNEASPMANVGKVGDDSVDHDEKSFIIVR
jgi:hypothetical protein